MLVAPHLISGQAEVIRYNFSVAKSAWQVINDVLVVQFIVLVQILLKGLLLWKRDQDK